MKMPTDGTITLARLRGRLSYDAETGLFHWRVSPSSKVPEGAVAGQHQPDGRIKITIDNITYRAHRLAWFYVHGEWPSDEIDHINRNPADNRLANLRLATRTENQANNPAQRNNASGFRGVSFCCRKKRWRAQIRRPGVKTVHLGYFREREAAADAYRRAAVSIYGEFAMPVRE